MTSSPSEAPSTTDPISDVATRIAEGVGGEAVVAHGTAKIRIPKSDWKWALTAARDQHGMIFLSWLSATDWSNDVAVGEEYDEEVEERYELLCAVSDLDDGHLVVFSTDVAKDDAVIESVADVYPGANWHEREAAEMFGIDFTGHPDLSKLYLPDGFEGHPLRKSFALLSREVKPWPGKVDVEDMPSTENPEAPPADTTSGDGEAEEDGAE